MAAAAAATPQQHANGGGSSSGVLPPSVVSAWEALTAAIVVPKAALVELVVEQLRADGYVDAAASLAHPGGAATDAAGAGAGAGGSSGGSGSNSGGSGGGETDADAALRVVVRDAVLRGEARTALALLSDHCGGLLATRPLLQLRLLQQVVVDLVCGAEAAHAGGSPWPAAADVVSREMLPLAAAVAADASAPPGDAAAAADVLEDTSLLLAFPQVVEAARPAFGGPPPSTPAATILEPLSSSARASMSAAASAAAAAAAAATLPPAVAALMGPDARARTAHACVRALLDHRGVPAVPRLTVLLQWLQHQEAAAAVAPPAAAPPTVSSTADTPLVDSHGIPLLGPRAASGGLAL